jgi:hypothetical protein
VSPPEGQIRAVAEALADVLMERGLLVAAGSASPARILDAAQVGAMLGRDRHWVYAHARELGAFRFGDGPKARLGFDLAAIERWKRGRALQTGRGSPAPAPKRRRPLATAAHALIPYVAVAESELRASRAYYEKMTAP